MFDNTPWMGVGQRWDTPADNERFDRFRDRIAFVEPALPNTLDALPRGFSVIGHSAELPMATARPLSPVLGEIAQQIRTLQPPWAGEHFCLNANAAKRELGYNFAPILNDKAIAAAVRNVREVQSAYGCPLHLETGPRYFAWDGKWDDHGALLEVSRETGSGIIVDLSHHICSMKNLRRPLTDGLSAMVLESTIEVHITGIGKHSTPGYYHDSHTVPISEAAWDLLNWTLDRTPNLKAVTLEHAPAVGDDDYERDLDRLLLAVDRRGFSQTRLSERGAA